MYWIPIIFVILEIIFLMLIPQFAKFTAMGKLKEKYKELNYDVNDLFENNKFAIYFLLIFGLYIILSMIYYVISLFFPIWFIGLIMLSYIIIGDIISKLFPNLFKKDYTSYSDFIDMDKIENVQVQRKLKLDNLNGTSMKTRLKILIPMYINSLIRLSAAVTIIILHYHYGL